MGSIKLNGSNAYAVLKETGVIPYGNTPRTLECYFKLTGENASTCLFSCGGTSSGTPLIYMGFINNAVYFEAGSGKYKFVSTTTYNDNEWHTLKFIVTGTQIKIYVDQIKEFETAATIDTSDSYFYLGCYGVSSVGSRPFNGLIDEVRVWSKALSEEEMFKTYNKPLTGREEGLVLNYSFDTNDTGTLVDKTGKHNGTGVNLEYSTEEGFIGTLFVVKQDGKYYSIKEEYYNTATKTYDEVTDIETSNFNDYGLTSGAFFEEVTIDGETFRPIDKFNNFTLISNTNIDAVSIVGLKTLTEMIVASNDFPTTIQSNIDFFESQTEITGNGEIKIAFSIDEGVTWKTHDGTDFIDLSITIPCKPYDELTEDELIQWNNARDEILANGIDSATLKTLDFNTLTFDKIRFAYVLHIDSIEDTALNKRLIWQFDAKGSMKLMKDSEIDIEVLPTGIKVTPKISSNMIKVNILPNGVTGSGSSSGNGSTTDTESPMTDAEIDALISNVLGSTSGSSTTDVEPPMTDAEIDDLVSDVLG